MRYSLLVILFFAAFSVRGQITVSTNQINFFIVYPGSPDSLSFDITNNSDRDYVVDDVVTFHDAFSVAQNTFTVPPGSTHTVWVKCDPIQNVKYADYLMVKSSSHPEPKAIFLFAFVKYQDPYYDLTQDKWHEDLKSALNTLLNFGTTDFTYNTARDSLFMVVENWKVNGVGAAQNTMECVYTGQTAVGYTSRADAQTNYNFNTEHTFPQSLFSQNWPMVADLHHLFGVTSSANSERSNKPFGVVTSPSWSVGGSKSNGSTFEPRDAQKGVVARALFYFVLRYQDFGGFVAPQENILRQWNKDFLPTAQDVNRNDLVFRMQSNRNPFVDHPELLDRIASVTSTNNGPNTPEVWHSGDTVWFKDMPGGMVNDGVFYVSNQGWVDMTVSNFAVSGGGFALSGTTPSTLLKDSVAAIHITYSDTAFASTSYGTLTFTTDDPNQSTVTISLVGNTLGVGVDSPFPGAQAVVYPNPAGDFLRVKRGDFIGDMEVQVWDLQGKLIGQYAHPAGQAELEIRGLESGMYLLKIAGGGYFQTEKVVIK